MKAVTRFDHGQGPELLIQFSHPDIAEADGAAGVSVGLEFDGRAVEFLVERLADVARFAFQFEVILHKNTVKECNNIGKRLH